ncbi:MAG: DUF481 domain-containing protein [Candidatus Korobacteraceae bacterium]
MSFRNACCHSLTVVALAFLPSIPGWCDQIELKDGDRVTGSIVKKDGKAVTVDSKNFGMVTVQWDAIASIQTDKPLTVVLKNKRTVVATLHSEEGRIRVAAVEEPQLVAAQDIVSLRNSAEQSLYEQYLDPGLLELWSITGSLNLAGTRGNADTSTLTTPVNFLRASNTSRTTAHFTSIRSTASVDGVSSSTARAIRGGWGFSRNLTRKVLLNSFNDYEYDQFQGLDLRVVLGGGMGYEFWSGEGGRFSLLAGNNWNREAFSPVDTPSFVRNSVEAYWGNEFNFKLNSRTTLVQSFRMFNNLSNTGEYRVNFDVGSTTHLTKWLTWNASVSERFLSNPVQGRRNNDLLYTTGLGFTFSR